jgi:hypothetical protein
MHLPNRTLVNKLVKGLTNNEPYIVYIPKSLLQKKKKLDIMNSVEMGQADWAESWFRFYRHPEGTPGK